ncbi:MAG: glycosyltransferase family 2 protein [Planctomycetes bacterium]|nr:glycosyltransferase family 2 protein [Planctomycetota bacterium]
MKKHTTDNDLITVAICSYNAADYLNKLIPSIAILDCSIPYEILIVDNNSTDNTKNIIKPLSDQIPVPLRYVLETRQGISYARNRAIEESLNSTFLAFIDSDELPDKYWLKSAVQGLIRHSADCVGGEISVDIPNRPKWLSDSVLLFLGKVNHGTTPFQIIDLSTPVWSGNIAYRTSIFSNGLQFDSRYNRKGSGIGGGEDAIMFKEILKRGYHIRYEPNMRIRHLIPKKKLNRSYFLKLHYIAGKKNGMYETELELPAILGIPRYMYLQLIKKFTFAIKFYFTQDQEYLRVSMNVTHQLGVMIGIFIKKRDSVRSNHARCR